VAQSLWRTQTAGDVTFLARVAGLDPHLAQQLDNVTEVLWAEWLDADALDRVRLVVRAGRLVEPLVGTTPSTQP
jgi:hypothetical protein